MIKKKDLIVGKKYEVDARNFDTAKWNGTEFIGLRYKFGQTYEYGELHWEDGAPHGTCKPLAQLD